MLSKRIALALSLLTLAACSTKPDDAPPPRTPEPAPVAAPPEAQAAPAAAAALTRVTDPSTVCMVNDQHMGNAQIPVQVDGKTYYGCCQMCEARLQKDVQVRLGQDPVTKQPVDKASAVIAKDASGKVLYFESEKTLATYLAQR